MGDQEPAYLRDVIASLPLDYGCRLLARPGRVAGPRGCLFIGVNQKSSNHPQNDVIDPKRKWRTRLLDHLIGADK